MSSVIRRLAATKPVTGAARRDNEGMPAPKRPGAPRPSSSATPRATGPTPGPGSLKGKPSARKPAPGAFSGQPGTPKPSASRPSVRRAVATPSAGVPKPARRTSPQNSKTRPGGPSGPGRVPTQVKPRIEAAGARGSLAGALSWRTAVLAVVVVLALAVLLPSLRVYFAQQENLRDLRAERDTATTDVADLHDDLARWDDPAYVVAQARERLAYVFPGETPYRVVDPEIVTKDAEPVSGAIELPTSTERSPWYTTLWDSIEQAGDTTSATPAPVPAP